jgi:hypothetical protein
MSTNEPRRPRDRRPGGTLGAYLAIGIGIGAGIGVALHNIGLGISIGIAIGIALGVAVDASQKRAAGGHDHADDGTGGDEEPPRPPLK